MDKNSAISLLLFYTYRHYKRVDLKGKRKQLIINIKQCDKLLQYLGDDYCSASCIKAINIQMDRINSWGYSLNIQLDSPCSAIKKDYVIIDIMKAINQDILFLSKKILFNFHIDQITLLLMGIHNLPRVFLDDGLQDPTHPRIHMTAEDAIDCVRSYLGNNYLP